MMSIYSLLLSGYERVLLLGGLLILLMLADFSPIYTASTMYKHFSSSSFFFQNTHRTDILQIFTNLFVKMFIYIFNSISQKSLTAPLSWSCKFTSLKTAWLRDFCVSSASYTARGALWFLGPSGLFIVQGPCWTRFPITPPLYIATLLKILFYAKFWRNIANVTTPLQLFGKFSRAKSSYFIQNPHNRGFSWESKRFSHADFAQGGSNEFTMLTSRKLLVLKVI